MQDSWAICRIFKKTNSTAQRALSLSCIPPLTETPNTSDSASFTKNDTIFFPTKTTLPSSFETHDHHQYYASISNTYPFDFVASCKPLFNNAQITNKLSHDHHHHLPILAQPSNFNTTHSERCTVDLSSILLNMSSSVLGDFGIKPTNDSTIEYLHSPQQQQQQQQFMNNYPQITLSHDHQMHAAADQFGAIRSSSAVNNGSFLPLNFPFNISTDDHLGKSSNFIWDSSSSCPSEVSTSLSTSNCYT